MVWPARVFLQERETTAEGVRMKGCSLGSQRALLLFDVLFSTCVPFPRFEKRLCSIADTEAISFQDLVGRLPRSAILDLTTLTDAPNDAWEEKSLVGTHEAHEIPAVVVLSGHNNLMQRHVWDLTWCHQVDL